MSILGIDISKYQLYDWAFWSSFDFQKASVGGVYWYIKRVCTTKEAGNIEQDKRWKNYEDDNAVLYDLGRYAYVRLSYDPIVQAKKYLEFVAGRKSRRAWIDLELETPQLSKKECADRLQKWLDIVEFGTGITPGIYTRQSWFDLYIEPRTEWKRYPLWDARYVSLDPVTLKPYMFSPWSDGYYKFKSWDNWIIWQHAVPVLGKALGAQSEEIDLDVFNGTMEQLIAFAKEGGDSLQTITNIQYKVFVDRLRIREEPNVNSKIIGTRTNGETLSVVDFGGTDFWVRDLKGWSAVQINNSKYMTRK